MAVALSPGAHLELGGEPLVVSDGANVTISSEGEGATIDAQGLSKCLLIQRGARVELINIRIINGNGDGAFGGGISVRDGCALRLVDCHVTDCVAELTTNRYSCNTFSCFGPDDLAGAGGGIAVWSSNLEIYNSVISACSAWAGGGPLLRVCLIICRQCFNHSFSHKSTNAK